MPSRGSTRCRPTGRSSSRSSRRSTSSACRPRRRTTPSTPCSPIRSPRNSRLGTYTNFVNLLDMCGIAVPTGKRSDGLPMSVTLLAAAGRDALTAALARDIQAVSSTTLGATGWTLPASPAIAPACGRQYDRGRGGRRASVRDAAQRPAEGTRRAVLPGGQDGACLSALRTGRPVGAQARPRARQQWRRRGDRRRDLAARRRRPSAASSRRSRRRSGSAPSCSRTAARPRVFSSNRPA